MNLFEILNAVDQLGNDDVVAVINQGVLTLAKRGEGYEVEREVEEMIEHEGVMLRRVDRNSKTGDFVRFSGSPFDEDTVIGKLYEVIDTDQYLDEHENRMGVYEWYSFEPGIEVFEVVGYGDMPPEQDVPLTANQQRAEIIQRAKEFRKAKKDSPSGKYYTISPENIDLHCYAEFHQKGNRVTCILKGHETHKIFSVGRADCTVSDVFNADIGKAIALARALKIDIPEEFTNAVQPDGVVAGMAVSYHNIYGDLKERTVERVKGDIAHLANGKRISLTFADEPGTIPVIIDDTNAIYEVLE